MPKSSKNSRREEIIKRLAKVKHAEKIRNEADKKFGWSRALKEYNGDFKSDMPSWMAGIEMIPINEVYAFAKTFVPSVYSRDPYLAVNPKGVKYILGSKMLELAVNAYWRELRLKRQVRRALFDAVFAEGIIKLGYSTALGDINNEDGEKSLDPSEYVGDGIFAKRISFKNFVRDPDSTDGLYDARWCAHQIIVPLEAVKASGMYDNTDDLQPNYSVEISSPSSGRGGPQFKSKMDYIVLWEEWDRDDMKVYTYTEGSDDFQMEKKWPYKFKRAKHGFPFELIRFNDSTDETYAPNLIGPWEPQLWEKMKIRAMELDHLKRFGRQYISEKGSLSKMEKDKLIKGITGSIIEKEQGKPDPTVLQYPPIQTDIYGVENRIDLDKDNISGQPNAVRSAPQKTHSRTLGEVDRLISAFQSRQTDPQGAVEDFSEELAKKLIALMQQYFDKDKYIRATQVDQPWLERQMTDNPDSDKFDRQGFLFNRNDIKNLEFEVEVRAGSTLPLDKKNRMQGMVSIIELGDKIGVQPGSKVSRVIGKNLVAEFDMPEIDSAFEESIRKMEAADKLAKVDQFMQNEMMGQKIKKMRQQVGGQGAANGGAPMIDPQAVI